MLQRRFNFNNVQTSAYPAAAAVRLRRRLSGKSLRSEGLHVAGEWWVQIVQWALFGLAMTLVMGWVARSRFRKRLDSDARTLAHPVSTLVIGLIGVTFFGGIAIISNTVGKNNTTTIWTTLIFIAFAFMSVPMIADYYFARHRVSDVGLDYGRMFGQRGAFGWSDVKRVRYASVMKWFAIDLHSGSTVRVSAMLTGLPEFARLLLAHVPRNVIDDEAYALLRETEQGKPPSVWG
jgi:hypothetical protein